MRYLRVVFGLLIFLVSYSTVLAQSEDAGLSMVVSPLPINLVTEPGGTVTADLKIKNSGNKTEELQVGIMKFSAYGEEGKPRLMDRENGDNYFDWMTFSEPVFKVAPNEWKTITATINVPKEAAFGYYYAVTFSRKEDLSKGKATKIVGATASLILLEVRVPNAIRDVEVMEFSTDKKFYEFLPTKFNIKLKNKGNVHLSPRGNIFIDSLKKKDLAVLEINEGKGNILPNSNRVFETKWSGGFPVYIQDVDGDIVNVDKNGKELRHLKWDFNKITQLRFGKYTAHMLLVYDDGKRDVPIEGRLSFWVIPWRLIFGGMIAIWLMWSGLKSNLKPLFDKLKKNK